MDERIALGGVTTEFERLLRIAGAYAASLGIWFGVSLLTGWQCWIADRQINPQASFIDFQTAAQLRGVAFALLTPLVFVFVRKYKSGMQHPVRYIGIYALAAVPFVVLYSCILWLIEPHGDLAFAATPLEWVQSGFADQITVYFAIVVTAHAYYFLKSMREQEREKREFQREAIASHLEALKLQIHPHFLFNALHGISTLMDSDRVNARKMLMKLSRLLRCTLEHNGSDLISLREELQLAREYVDLEKLRLGTRLAVDWCIDPDSQHFLVPQFILQPLMENAIRHGVSASPEGGWIRITSHQRGGALEISIRNRVGSSRKPGFGVGLKNTAARLKYLYSDDASFSFTQTGQHMATATIVVPALGSGLREAADVCSEDARLLPTG